MSYGIKLILGFFVAGFFLIMQFINPSNSTQAASNKPDAELTALLAEAKSNVVTETQLNDTISQRIAETKQINKENRATILAINQKLQEQPIELLIVVNEIVPTVGIIDEEQAPKEKKKNLWQKVKGIFKNKNQ